jgi:hypothetical protein
MLSINFSKSCKILIVVFATTINISMAQSYHHSPNDTIISNAPFDDVSVFNIIQVHTIADTIQFKWEKQSVYLPATWEATLCDYAHCYTTLEDTGTTDPIVYGGDGLMSLHINPYFQAGTGIIRYSIYATNSPFQVDTLTWIITATAPSGIEKTSDSQPLIYNVRNQIVCKNLNNNYSRALLYDLNGRLLLDKNISSDEVALFTEEYHQQLLILRLVGKQDLTIKIFNY